jgi:hypothetical protein
MNMINSSNNANNNPNFNHSQQRNLVSSPAAVKPFGLLKQKRVKNAPKNVHANGGGILSSGINSSFVNNGIEELMDNKETSALMNIKIQGMRKSLFFKASIPVRIAVP